MLFGCPEWWRAVWRVAVHGYWWDVGSSGRERLMMFYDTIPGDNTICDITNSMNKFWVMQSIQEENENSRKIWMEMFPYSFRVGSIHFNMFHAYAQANLFSSLSPCFHSTHAEWNGIKCHQLLNSINGISITVTAVSDRPEQPSGHSGKWQWTACWLKGL